MINTIILDLDDVLNTLAPCVLNAVGCDIGPSDYANFPQEFGYNAHEAANFLLGTHVYDYESFWNSFTQQMWATVPVSNFCHWLIEKCRSLVGERNVHLATSPISTPQCVAGKLEWIHTFCPHWLHRQFSITTNKELLAQPDTLLIDDCWKNIGAFHAHMGHAITVPRPWNSYRGHDPASHITRHLKKFYFPKREN